jgi:hypothetical protein
LPVSCAADRCRRGRPASWFGHRRRRCTSPTAATSDQPQSGSPIRGACGGRPLSGPGRTGGWEESRYRLGDKPAQPEPVKALLTH